MIKKIIYLLLTLSFFFALSLLLIPAAGIIIGVLRDLPVWGNR